MQIKSVDKILMAIHCFPHPTCFRLYKRFVSFARSWYMIYCLILNWISSTKQLIPQMNNIQKVVLNRPHYPCHHCSRRHHRHHHQDNDQHKHHQYPQGQSISVLSLQKTEQILLDVQILRKFPWVPPARMHLTCQVSELLAGNFIFDHNNNIATALSPANHDNSQMMLMLSFFYRFSGMSY